MIELKIYKFDKSKYDIKDKNNYIYLIPKELSESNNNNYAGEDLKNSKILEFYIKDYVYNGPLKYSSILKFLITLIGNINEYKKITSFNIINEESYDKGFKPIYKGDEFLFSMQGCDANKTAKEIILIKK